MYVPGSPANAHHVATYGPHSKFGYKDFIPMFRAEKFNPNAWVDLFASAGAQYVVPVAEHCDGFAMYDSQFTTWDAAKMGPHRDVLGELATATRAHGLRFGASSHRAEHWWWYGLGTHLRLRRQRPRQRRPLRPRRQDDPARRRRRHQGARPQPLRAVAPARPGLRRRLARPLHRDSSTSTIPTSSTSTGGSASPSSSPPCKQFAAYYYDRNAEQHAGTEEAVLTYKIEAMPANTATLDIERGKMDTLRLLPWQTDTSISIHSWGYVDHDEYRDAKSLIHQLVDTVSKNGNLLLNVGPKSDGTIPEEAKAVLLQMGAWLKVNGEAIYGTRPWTVFGEGPTKAGKNSTAKNSDIQTYTSEDIRFTTRDGNLYATALGWPASGQLRIQVLGSGLPYLKGKVCSVSLLGSDAHIPFTQKPDRNVPHPPRAEAQRHRLRLPHPLRRKLQLEGQEEAPHPMFSTRHKLRAPESTLKMIPKSGLRKQV